MISQKYVGSCSSFTAEKEPPPAGHHHLFQSTYPQTHPSRVRRGNLHSNRCQSQMSQFLSSESFCRPYANLEVPGKMRPHIEHHQHRIQIKKQQKIMKMARYTEVIIISVTYRYEIEKYNVGLRYTLL